MDHKGKGRKPFSSGVGIVAIANSGSCMHSDIGVKFNELRVGIERTIVENRRQIVADGRAARL